MISVLFLCIPSIFAVKKSARAFLSKNLVVLGHVLLLEHMLAGIRVSLGLRSAGIFSSASGHKVSSGDQVMAPVELGSKGYRPSGGELCWFFSGIGWMIGGDGEVCQWLSGALDVQEQKLYLLDCLLFVSCLNRCGRVWDNCHCSLCYVGYQSTPWSRNCFFKSLCMLLVSCINVFWLNWYHHFPKIPIGGENN